MSRASKVSLLALFVFAVSFAALSQGVRITYQGSLKEDGLRPTGSYDFKFSLFDQASGGIQQGGSITNLAVEVVDGLFTTPMNLVVFDVVTGPWLEVGVRPGGTTGEFTLFDPRQELTSTASAVSAVFSLQAASLNAETGDQLNGYVDDRRVFHYRVFPDVDAAGLVVGAAGYSNVVNVASGSPANEIAGGVQGATIAGGGADQFYNDVEFGLQYLDRANVVGADFGTVGGGAGNSALGFASTVAGGFGNSIQPGAVNSTIGGGSSHRIAEGSAHTTITGGYNNDVGTDANYAIVAGGRDNAANAPNAFAAGTRAQASHRGAFVWADSEFNSFPSVRDDEFAIRAENGVRIQAGAANNALEVGSGGIKVTGAGVGTATPVFVHRATAGNISGHTTIIDNVHCNNQPDAILLVTHNWSKDTAADRYETYPFGVYYTSGQWRVFHEDFSAMPVGRAFNVLVIKP